MNEGKFEDTKICYKMSRIVEKRTVQWQKQKRQTMIYTILHRKIKVEQHEPW